MRFFIKCCITIDVKHLYHQFQYQIMISSCITFAELKFKLLKNSFLIVSILRLIKISSI